MELSSLRYLCFWSIISQVSLLVAVFASEGVCFPVPEFIHVISNKLIYIPACFSSFYAFLVKPPMEPDLDIGNISEEFGLFFTTLFSVVLAPIFSMWSLWFQLFTVLDIFIIPLLIIFVSICFVFLSLRYRKSKKMGNFIGFGGPLLVYPSHSLCCALFVASLFSVAYSTSRQGLTVPVARSFSCSVIAALILVLLFLNRVPSRIIGSSIVENTYGKIKLIEIPLGLFIFVLVQYCIQVKSVSLLLMLSSSAIYWLANLAMTRPPTDLGIFNFLIGSVLECVVSLFGLRKLTWIVFAGCVLLVLLRWKLDSVTLRYPQARTSIMSNWRILEEQNVKALYSFFRFNEAKQMEDESKGKRKLSADELSLFANLLLCAGKINMEKKTGKEEEEESKDKQIDNLLHFTLHQLKQNEEIIEEEEEEEEEISRDEQIIHMLSNLYFQLRNIEENGIENQTKNCQIVLCSYLLLRLLEKRENENEKASANC